MERNEEDKESVEQKDESSTKKDGSQKHDDAGHDLSVNSFNEAIRKELEYLDMVVATPFRVVRRSVGENQASWAQGLEELTWAVEGMARVPVKMLQAAFGENFSKKN